MKGGGEEEGRGEEEKNGERGGGGGNQDKNESLFATADSLTKRKGNGLKRGDDARKGMVVYNCLPKRQSNGRKRESFRAHAY